MRRGDDLVGTMFPQRNFHFAQEQPQSEVAIRTNPIEDVYLVVTSFDQDGTAALRAFVNPLTWWIWAGAFVMLTGMGVLLTGAAVATASFPVPQPLSRPVVVTR